MTRNMLTRAFGLASLVLAGAAAAGCTGASMRRVDPNVDDDLGGTMIDSADITTITDRAAADLATKLLQSPRNDLIVSYAPMKNESVQPMNTALITDRLIDSLVNSTSPRVKYRATEHLDEVIKEREAKRTGVYSSTEKKDIVGVNFLLTGRIVSLSKKYEGDRADYFQIQLRLVDAESGVVEWSNRYEFKKQGDSGVIYQ